MFRPLLSHMEVLYDTTGVGIHLAGVALLKKGILQMKKLPTSNDPSFEPKMNPFTPTIVYSQVY